MVSDHGEQGLTTAFMDGFHSLFTAAEGRARGYQSIEHLITMVVFAAGELRIACHPSGENVEEPA
jgi:hypothetical protein